TSTLLTFSQRLRPPIHPLFPYTTLFRSYHCNRLRVVPEVSYSPHFREGEYNPRLDLVLFVNGIPVATLELKSEFKQSVENAKRQDRKSTRLNSSHVKISYAVFCLKKKKT